MERFSYESEDGKRKTRVEMDHEEADDHGSSRGVLRDDENSTAHFTRRAHKVKELLDELFGRV